MGRHSVPDPDDSDDRRPDPGPGFGGDASGDTGSITGRHGESEAPTTGFGAEPDTAADEPEQNVPWFERPTLEPDDPDQAGYGDEPDQRDEPGFRDEPDYRDDAYWQAERDARYDDAADDAVDAGPVDPGRAAGPETRIPADADESPTTAFAATLPRPPAGPQHTGSWDGGEWTGSHRAVQPARRGVSVGVIVALVTVVVVVGGIIAWRFFGDALSNRSQVSAARCVEGEVAVAVVADPSIADQVRTLADQYNQNAAPVGDKCVKVGVTPAGSDRVLDGFAGTWPGDLGGRPALWIPASSLSESRLEAASGAQTVSDSRSLVTSPVMLAVRPELKTALGQQTWANLPGLQANPTGLDGLNLPGWGNLRLALPRTGDADASALAAEAAAIGTAPAGAPATAGASAISTLVGRQPQLADADAGTAMDALLSNGDPATSPVHAVAATEQQLVARAASSPEAKDRLAAWLPAGGAAIADYPTVLLSGDWLAQEQVGAASEFARFLRKPEALADFAEAGFRADGTTPPDSDVTDYGALPAPVAVGDAATRATLADAVASPAANPAVTIMLDQSMNTEEGGRSRLANVTAALADRLAALPPTAAVGLWTFDGVAGRSEVPLGPLGDPVGGTPRSEALAGNLRGQTASGGGAVSFTTLRLLYTEANANYREGQPNSVLVLTAGPHTDQSLDGAGLQDYVRSAFQQARPVAINVVDFGADPDRSSWESVSQITGGTYTNVADSTAPDLQTALTAALG